ncbi:hypothetical protein [Paraeggerthella hongkongensis]|uniref:Uncharacterized protein n=1 Tax=Paraeggerthella hongkongensis TaxID=230658 RepID=A0A3N0B7A3_9ACTN|nr:hypothetical protein [Paraeggerthella hongkongensis]RNL42955.1 hypothetical protein DMP08_08195 [Paraeggerthella hongkongensis]
MNDSKTNNAYKILVVMLSVAILVTGGLLLAKTMTGGGPTEGAAAPMIAEGGSQDATAADTAA